ncbi:MAG: DUF3313 domain-containing protein [Gammaproteobacteria bacterium]|nr:DUF3313 domain-containing protein [Gammaproteobacteria bacterium]
MNKLFNRSLLAAGVLALSLQNAFAAGSEFIDPGAMIWQKPDFNRAAYTKVMIEPITLFISPDSEYKGMKADELKSLSDEFAEVITKTLEPDIPIVHQGGPGVLYIRAALTDVKVAKKKRGLLGYTPIGFVVTSVAHSGVGGISLKDASLEVEMLDPVSGERLGVLVDKAPKAADDKEMSWDAIDKTLAYYATRFKARMQAAK